MAERMDDYHVDFVRFSQRSVVRERQKVKRFQAKVIGFVTLAGFVALGLIAYFAKYAGAAGAK